MLLQEAAACGCALVTTDVGATRDYFQHGVEALIVPPRDVNAMAEALVYFITHEPERRRMAEAAQRRMQEFTWARFAQQLEDIFTGRWVQPAAPTGPAAASPVSAVERG